MPRTARSRDAARRTVDSGWLRGLLIELMERSQRTHSAGPQPAANTGTASARSATKGAKTQARTKKGSRSGYPTVVLESERHREARGLLEEQLGSLYWSAFNAFRIRGFTFEQRNCTKVRRRLVSGNQLKPLPTTADIWNNHSCLSPLFGEVGLICSLQIRKFGCLVSSSR
jgi:hypothetical protein